jgi:hypothetical protein
VDEVRQPRPHLRAFLHTAIVLPAAVLSLYTQTCGVLPRPHLTASLMHCILLLSCPSGKATCRPVCGAGLRAALGSCDLDPHSPWSSVPAILLLSLLGQGPA